MIWRSSLKPHRSEMTSWAATLTGAAAAGWRPLRPRTTARIRRSVVRRVRLVMMECLRYCRCCIGLRLRGPGCVYGGHACDGDGATQIEGRKHAELLEKAEEVGLEPELCQ